MSGYTEIIAIACALATLVVAAAWVPSVARVFIIAQAAFWSLSYVARPLVLLAVQPEPHYGDNVPDPRLAVLGYDRGIALVLHHVVFGLWVYAILIVGYAIWSRHHPVPRLPAMTGNPDFVPALVTIYVVGLLGRGASYASGSTGHAGDVDSANPILAFVSILATVAALGLIIFIRPARPRTTALLIGALLAGELVWTVVVESKTPILGAALAVAVRFAILGWTKAKMVGVLAIAVLGIGGFGWLQSFKTTEVGKAEAAMTSSAYPPSVRPFLSILRRFDLLEAATDAYYHGTGYWLTPAEEFRHAALSLIPTQLLGAPKFQSGTAWADDVRGASVDMTRVSVSLAEGNINEGYVIGGYTGIVVSVGFTFLLLLAWAKALYSRYFPMVVLALALTGASSLFERGILGSMEALGKFLQAAVLATLIYLAVKEYRRRAEPQVRSQPPHQPLLVIGKRGSEQWD
ncbi:hypothetical protein [Nocardia vinacea]|uniref:hypothetical protein n=1 Tax=Nocardia vinacea TaxID=96468 RepID=UPI0002DB58D3|nr:hypothetical protein [Nocardia vinacea]